VRGFRDRSDAGRRLAAVLLDDDARRPVDPIVWAIPRGGVPVAAEVARVLGAPLDVAVVRKLGAPGRPELGIGAVGEDGVVVTNEPLLTRLRVGPDELAATVRREAAEVDRRVERYRDGRPPEAVAGRTAVVVDDGLATGFTALAAVRLLRGRGAAAVVLAVPVASPDTAHWLAAEADRVVAVLAPEPMVAVGEWYADFTQTSDDEVVALLRRTPPVGEV
jgi:putative phosphoribosyl transferase